MAFQFPTRHTHRGGAFLSMAPRTFPYENTDPISNSAAMNCVAWIQRNFLQADLGVYAMDAEGAKELQDGHPLVALLERPNPFYELKDLWAGTMLSYHLDGNAYWLKARNARGFGAPTQLWYEPHWSIKPHWPEDGSAFIDYYERRVNGTIERIAPENVIHFRNGINPANPRYGMAPIKSALLNVFTDTEVSLWVAALCKNMAIPGVVMNPTEMIGLSPEKAEAMKQQFKRKFGGDNRGEPLILDFPASISTIGFNPADMDFGAITMVAEARIAGALGVPPIVAGLSAGLDASTYNNLENLRKAAFEESLIPTWMAIAAHLTSQLLPDFEVDVDGMKVAFDTSEIRALQENQSEKESRAIKALMAGVATLNETRAQFGYDPLPSGDYTYIPGNVTVVPMGEPFDTIEEPVEEEPEETEIEEPDDVEEPDEDEADVEEASGLPVLNTKAEIWNGVPVLRQPTDLEARAIKAIDEEYQAGVIQLGAILLTIREQMIEDVAEQIRDLDPADYARVEIRPTEEQRARVEAALLLLFMRGATLVNRELRQQGIDGEVGASPNAEQVAILAALLLVRIANDVQARAVGVAVRSQVQSQVTGEDAGDLEQSVREAMLAASTAYVMGAAGEMTNVMLAQGRDAEMAAKGPDIRTYVYSAILDVRTCSVCRAADGMRGPRESLPDVPNPNCDGGARCRCVILPVATTNVTASASNESETKARYRGQDINLKPTDGMVAEAQRGLDWRDEFGRGGTVVGIARARDIVNRRELSPRTVRRMFSFFSRHEVDKRAEGFRQGEDGYPSNGRIAWALWGGDAGYAWAKKKRNALDRIDEG